MVKHIVMWDFRDSVSSEDRQRELGVIRAALATQVGVVPGLESIDVHLNITPGAHMRDIVLVATFTDVESLRAYHRHPSHQKVREVVDPLVTDPSEIDYGTL